MGKINLLHESVFNKIAAGEVVERPSSVIKELIENSIDAGASSIDISIERSGMRSICILDNGSGMDSDDAVLCFEPHSTSKIRNQEDIFRIYTMGFRGEALPSIASVSKVRLKTRQPDSVEGTEIIINGGKLISQTPAGCAPGTEIIISDLFFNVPARKKFLKGEVTEQKHVYETVIQLALANPPVSFVFKNEGKIVFNSKGEGDLKARISLLLGREVADNSVYIENSNNGYFISGYFSKPSFSRNSRRDQRFFVNGRPVKSILLTSAVREAYGSLVMHGLYPAVTLFVKVPVEDVDINVHPSKQEVRFRNERILSNFIIDSLKAGLRESITPAPAVSISKIPTASLIDSSRVNYVFPEKEQREFRFESPSHREPSNPKADLSVNHEADSGASANPQAESNLSSNDLTLPGCGFIKVLGALDKTYIIAVSDIGLVLIDQHAAHERILFEKILNDFSRSKFRQDLLIPVTIDLARMESDFIKKYQACFDKIGFGIDFFGENTILIHSIPSALKQENISGIISDILDGLINKVRQGGAGIDEVLIAREACSLAVKAHDLLGNEEIDALIRDLSKCSIPFNCPHGRPTVINISIKELEKRFGRVN